MIYGLIKGNTTTVKATHNVTIYGEGIEDSYISAMNNAATPYYALLICLWATIFPIIWSKFKYIYSFKWGTLTYQLFDERELVKFTYLKQRGPIVKTLVYSTTWLFTFLCFLLGTLYCLVMVYLQGTLTTYCEGKIPEPDLTISAMVSFINTIIVTLLVNPFFEWLSLTLTGFERHHFDSGLNF